MEELWFSLELHLHQVAFSVFGCTSELLGAFIILWIFDRKFLMDSQPRRKVIKTILIFASIMINSNFSCNFSKIEKTFPDNKYEFEYCLIMLRFILPGNSLQWSFLWFPAPCSFPSIALFFPLRFYLLFLWKFCRIWCWFQDYWIFSVWCLLHCIHWFWSDLWFRVLRCWAWCRLWWFFPNSGHWFLGGWEWNRILDRWWYRVKEAIFLLLDPPASTLLHR